MDMALYFLKLENRTSMVGWITQVTPGANAAWYSNDYRLEVGQPIPAWSSVLAAIKIEPGAPLSEWSLTVKFFQGANVTVRFGTQHVNGVLQPIVGAVPGPRLRSRATSLPPAGPKRDWFAGVVSIVDPRPTSGSAWTDTLAAVTADHPLLVLSVVNKTSRLAGVDSVTQQGVWESHSRPVRSLREGAWIATDDGQGANLVTATYELVRNQPFRLEVLVDVGVPPSVRATPTVAIRIWATLLPGRSWHLAHSETSDYSLWSVGTLVVAPWGIDYMVTFKRKLAPKPFEESPGVPLLQSAP